MASTNEDLEIMQMEDDLEFAGTEIAMLRTQLAASDERCRELEKDRDRLDWLGVDRRLHHVGLDRGGDFIAERPFGKPRFSTFRSAIDAARSAEPDTEPAPSVEIGEKMEAG